MTALLFTVAATSAMLTVNALRKPVPPGRRFPPLWLPGMVVSELAPWALVAALASTLLTWAVSGGTGMGRAAAALFLLSAVGAAVLMRRSWQAAVEGGLRPSLLDLWRVGAEPPNGVSVSEDISYFEGLTMTVIRREAVSMAPALVYLHPGSWMRGGPGRQARALLYGLVERGWVVLDVGYPLSPAATFPEHLVGVKRAISWAKTSGGDLGIDPKRIAVAGGSSGAHLAALAALSDSIEGLQPGFESADTSVIACAPHYGIFDLLVRNPTRYDWPFVARHVMKARPHESPELYRLGSPIDLAHPGAPPFYVVHGEHDSVVLSAESEHFVAALRGAGVDATYHGVRGGQHGFDYFASLRSRAVASRVIDFLEKAAMNGGAPHRHEGV